MKKTYNKTSQKLDQIMDFIVAYNNENGYSPSLRQIMVGLNITTPSLVKYYLDILEDSGQIVRGDAPRRIITLPNFSNSEKQHIEDVATINKIFDCPIVGSVAAGVPILATENIMGYYPLPASDYNASGTFMLKVVGDSMIDAGIHEGDIIIVGKDKVPTNSKIVVAIIEDSATVKRFYRKENTIILHPENSLYSDIVLTKNDEFLILGVVVGLIKKF